MEQKADGIVHKSGRYPWGTKPDQIVEINIPCELCGELHIEHAIDGHVCVPHWCESCWRKVVSEYMEEKQYENH